MYSFPNLMGNLAILLLYLACLPGWNKAAVANLAKPTRSSSGQWTFCPSITHGVIP